MPAQQEKKKCQKAPRAAWKRGRTKRVKKAARERRWAKVKLGTARRRVNRLLRRIARRVSRAAKDPRSFQLERLLDRENELCAARARYVAA